MRCPACGHSTEEYGALLKIAAKASDLIYEGKKEENITGVVAATRALMKELGDFVETFGDTYDEVQ